MKKVGGAGVVASHGGILWLVLGLALVAAPQARAACDCSAAVGSYAWLVNTKVRFNNDATIIGNVGANLPGGMVRFGQRSCQGVNFNSPCAGNSVSVSGDLVNVGTQTSIAGSRSNRLKLGPGAVVRNPPLLSVTLPLVSSDPSSVCGAFTSITCGGANINVPWYGNQVITPGTYGELVVGNGATITLGAGTYTFCSVKIGSGVTGDIADGVSINVVEMFSVGSGTNMLTPSTTPFVLNVEGHLVRISQGSVIEAEVRAPFGKIKIQRNAGIVGCSCSDSMTSDKHHFHLCEDGGGGSPSAAFVD
jgi:hypothetical protein